MKKSNLLVIEPAELKAWRLRLGKTQEEVAKAARTDRERVVIIEQRIVGRVTTYKRINDALRTIENAA